MVALVVAVMGSALGVVYSKHLSREAFSELSRQQELGHELDVEWARLRLEEGALTADGRVERIARERLGMTPLTSSSTVVIEIHE